MNFKYFCCKTDLLDEFDNVSLNYTSLNESHIGDLDVGNVIEQGLGRIKSPNVKSIIGVLATIANFSGKRLRDIIKLFSKDGFVKIRNFIEQDIIGSDEVQCMLKLTNDPDYFKGYRGLENYINRMKENNPSIVDSLTRAMNRLLS